MYAVIIFSIFVMIGSVNAYKEVENNIEEELLADYNYAEIQDIVISGKISDFPQYDAEQMLSRNDDFCGWIFIMDTPINYPVVQAPDNEYYLNHSFEKEYSKFGCVFMSPGTTYDDDNIIIHGHNMGKEREEMFSSLLKYEDKVYAQEHNEIWFSHINGNIEEKYKVFAVVNYDFGNPEDFYYMISNFETEKEFKDYVEYLISQSMYKSDFFPENQLLILSTCYNIYGDSHRMLVCASRIDEGV